MEAKIKSEANEVSVNATITLDPEVGRAWNERHNRLQELLPELEQLTDELSKVVLRFTQAAAEAGRVAKELHAVSVDMPDEGMPDVKAFGVRAMKLRADALDTVRTRAVDLALACELTCDPLSKLQGDEERLLNEEIEAGKKSEAEKQGD